MSQIAGPAVFTLLSVALVMLDSIPGNHDRWGTLLLGGELLITTLFER